MKITPKHWIVKGSREHDGSRETVCKHVETGKLEEVITTLSDLGCAVLSVTHPSNVYEVLETGWEFVFELDRK